MSPRSRALSAQMKTASTAAILEAAEHVFGETGFHAATTEMVARRAGVSKGLVFNYFPTKDDLLAALVSRRLNEQLAYWKEIDFRGAPGTKLRQIADLALDCAAAQPQAHRLYFSLLLQPGASTAVQAAVDALKPGIAQYYNVLEGIFSELGSPAPRAQAYAFQAALGGIAQTLAIQPALIKRPELFPLETIKDELVSAFGRRRISKPARSARSRRKLSR
jgi:AcrR family transcriptional regulator